MSRKLRFIGVGTGRCGTRYLRDTLAKGGVPTMHEQHFLMRQVCCGARDAWKHDHLGEVSAQAVPFIQLFEDVQIWHQVRHPQPFVTGLIKFGFWQGKWQVMKKYITRTGDDVLDSYRYWVEWNKKCEEVAPHRYLRWRVEDINEQLIIDLGARVDVKVKPATMGDIEWKEKQLWHDLPKDKYIDHQVAPMAERYGYVLQ